MGGGETRAHLGIRHLGTRLPRPFKSFPHSILGFPVKQVQHCINEQLLFHWLDSTPTMHGYREVGSCNFLNNQPQAPVINSQQIMVVWFNPKTTATPHYRLDTVHKVWAAIDYT